MKKWMAVFTLSAVLFSGAVIWNQAVPAWEEMWTKTALLEEEKLGWKGNQGRDGNGDPAAGQANAGAGQGDEKPDISLYSQSAVLIDGDSGRVLFGKNENEIRPMASTTKIMTCILALESGHGDDIITISKNASSQPEVHLGAPAGRKFYLKDLLYSLMLESHNDTAVAIAEHIGRTTEGFAAMMNQKARDIGCKNTFFITPNGLDKTETGGGKERSHSTTAADLARIMRYCVYQSPKKEEFLEITGASSHTFSDLEGKGSYSCVNHNAFLSMMEGAFSGKTGFTSGAGYCYVGALKDGERNFIIALLGCGWPPHKTYKWTDARRLFQYGLDNYEYRNVWREVEIPEVTVKNGVPKDGDVSRGITVQAEIDDSQAKGKNGENQLNLLLKEGENTQVALHMEKELEAPVYKGDGVGRIEYRLNGETAAVYPVVLAEGAGKIDFLWCMEHVIEAYLNK